jgi:ATP-dependent Clp protease ATP-binding subunit ClpB
VCERLAKQGLGLDLTAEVREYLAEQGYDPTYGARPLKRAIQRCLLDPLSLDVLDGKFVEGDTIYAELDTSKKVVFSKA